MSIETCTKCYHDIDTDFEEGHYSIRNVFTCDSCTEPEQGMIARPDLLQKTHPSEGDTK